MTHDPTDLAGAEAQRERDRKRAERLAEEDRRDFQKLMADAWGRRVVWRLLERARVFHTVFNSNALEMARAEGRREFGLMVLADVHAMPEQFAAMLNESAERK